MKYMLIFLLMPLLLNAEDHFDIKYPLQFSKVDYDYLVSLVGYVYPPHSVVNHSKFENNKLMFKAQYQLMNFGLRSNTPAVKKADFHLILAGDSNVFGEGCDENNTVTAQLALNLPHYHVYNFGHRGGGPHNTLSLLEHFPVQNLIQEKKGIFIYDFFTYMLERSIGAKNYIAWDNGLSPWYELDENKEAVFKGQLKQKKISKLYSYIAKSSVLNWLFPVLPQINQGHIQLVAKILSKMKKNYLREFPDGRFIVLLNDKTTEDKKLQQLSALLKEELKKENIETLWMPYDETINMKDGIMGFADGHFNPRGQKWQADLISELIKNLSSSSTVKR